MTRVAVLYLVLVFVLVASTKAQAGAPAGIEIAELPLVAWGASRAHVLPDTLPDFATPGQRALDFRAFVEALASSDRAKATREAPLIKYQLVTIHEAGTWLIVASDDSGSGRDSTIVINTSPTRDIILEAPHVPFEVGTGEEAVLLLRDLNGDAALISGAHRCASKSFTACDGKTTVCGTSEGYRAPSRP